MSKSAYFRDLFEKKPHLLDGPHNDEIRDSYLADHPGEEWSKQHQQSAANIKSHLRSEHGMVKRRKGRKGKKAAKMAVVAVANGAPVARVGRPPKSASHGTLEDLELQIDACLHLAMKVNIPAMENTVKHLRVARRSVAWAMGEPAGSGS